MKQSNNRSTVTGFEPARRNARRFQIFLLNHSDILSWQCGNNYIFWTPSYWECQLLIWVPVSETAGHGAGEACLLVQCELEPPGTTSPNAFRDTVRHWVLINLGSVTTNFNFSHNSSNQCIFSITWVLVTITWVWVLAQSLENQTLKLEKSDSRIDRFRT